VKRVMRIELRVESSPHPGPLPSDGRGRNLVMRLAFVYRGVKSSGGDFSIGNWQS
jgi:hypothetical protein